MANALMRTIGLASRTLRLASSSSSSSLADPSSSSSSSSSSTRLASTSRGIATIPSAAATTTCCHCCRGVFAGHWPRLVPNELHQHQQLLHHQFSHHWIAMGGSTGARRAMSDSARRNVHQVRASVSHDEDSESDSDCEQDLEKMPRAKSHFWRRKMRTLHSHLDVNKDGVISYEDFRLLGERFTELGHLSDQQNDEFKVVLRKTWMEQWGEISPYNLVDIEKYLIKMHHVLEDKSLRKKVHHFLPYLFKAVDKDKSGEISVQEFKLFFKCLGLDNDDAVVSFSYIDTNEDGKISMQEFVKLGRDFFLTQDHTKPSKHFWGPLVD